MEHKVNADDFESLKLIGKGAHSKVLLVRHRETKEIFAMKMVKKEAVQSQSQLEHIRTERNVLAKVQHPFIVRLKYAFHNRKKLYFVMEYCPGGELYFHLSRERRFAEPQAKFYAASLILALEYLHESHVIYRE